MHIQGGQNVRIGRILFFLALKLYGLYGFFSSNCTDCTDFQPGNTHFPFFRLISANFSKPSVYRSRMHFEKLDPENFCLFLKLILKILKSLRLEQSKLFLFKFSFNFLFFSTQTLNNLIVYVF